MKHIFFIFSAISHDPRYLQNHTIWQNKGLNLTNLIYFIIYVDKNTEKGVKMVIYDGGICLTTLYFDKIDVFDYFNNIYVFEKFDD